MYHKGYEMISDKSLELFKKAAIEIPAYKQFLVSKKFAVSEVKTVADFTKIPMTSKKDYLQMAEHKDLVWAKNLSEPLWFCSTSGSTGEPYYFPRDDTLAEQTSY